MSPICVYVGFYTAFQAYMLCSAMQTWLSLGAEFCLTNDTIAASGEAIDEQFGFELFSIIPLVSIAFLVICQIDCCSITTEE